jgi:SPP1 family predicted phage head-tail adaptor
MRAGRLRHTIEIQNPIASQDASGGVVETFSLFRRVRASVEPISARERLASAAIIGDATSRIWIRFLEGFTVKSRILFRGEIYNIRAIRNVRTEDAMIEILATVGGDLG